MQRINGRSASQTPKRPFTGRLLKRIDPGDAKAREWRAALAAPRDKSGLAAFLQSEFQARWRELDKFFDLDMQQSDIWRLRALALIEHKFGIQSNDPRWWERLATKLAGHYVPGFSIKKARDKKHGAPLQWSHEQLAQLFADVEFLKKSTDGSVRYVCAELPKRKVYKGRWGRYKEATLRKAYSRAQALRQNSLEFTLYLCGGEIFFNENPSDPIKAAINRHALKA
jgi:hypothetical protein